MTSRLRVYWLVLCLALVVSGQSEAEHPISNGSEVLAEAVWLCIGEEAASVFQRDGQVVGSSSGPSNQSFLVSAKGAKFFGEDNYLTESCDMTPDGEPAQCFDRSGLYTFRGYRGDIFVMNGVGSGRDGGYQHWIIAGKCKEL